MLKAPYIKPGDKVAFVAPAGKIKAGSLDLACKFWQNKGFEIVFGNHVYDQVNQFAGSDAERLDDLQQMMDDASVRVIHFARGGYGSARIVQKLDFTNFLKASKWLVGFSDITVFHSAMNRIAGFASVHAAMPGQLSSMKNDLPAAEELFAFLSGNLSDKKFFSSEGNKEGKLENKELIGGNLSILYSLRGTPVEYDYTNKVLFIEDLGEYIYHIDRILTNMKLSGILSRISGLLVGGFSEMKDQDPPFGKNVRELILDAVKDYNYPVAFGFPAGHFPENYPLLFGAKINLEVQSNQSTLSYNE